MKVNLFSVLLTTTMLFILQTSYAEIFRWVDESGKIRIGIKPSDEPDNVEKNQDKSTKTSKALQVITDPVIPEVVPAVPETVVPETVVPETVVPEAIEEQTAPAAKIIEIPQTIAPVVKPDPEPVVVTPEVIPPIEEEMSARERSKEMCVVFTGYVNDYKEKVGDCSSSFCGIYKRSLARYKKKRESYCK